MRTSTPRSRPLPTSASPWRARSLRRTARSGSRRRRRPHGDGADRRGVSEAQEHALHQDDVEPAAELAADLRSVPTCRTRSARGARSRPRGRRRCGRSPSGSRGRRPGGGARRAGAGRCPRPAGRGARRPSPRRCVEYAGRSLNGESDPKPTTSPSLVDGHDRGVAAGVLVDPLDLLVERAGTEVEGDRRLARPRGCRSPGSPRRRRRSASRMRVGPSLRTVSASPRRGRLGRPACYPCGSAPLAQSAEHFHGKEGVYGSSP